MRIIINVNGFLMTCHKQCLLPFTAINAINEIFIIQLRRGFGIDRINFVVSLFVVSALPFARYLTDLGNMMLI